MPKKTKKGGNAPFPKEATAHTAKANKAVLQKLPFNNREDFELAEQGAVAKTPNLIVKDDRGVVAWDMNQYSFIKGDAPDTVNPSLWRQAMLENACGLFKVSEKIYQIRGYDLSNMTILVGNSGYIVIDPLISAETARAGMELVYEKLGKKPIRAVIHTHSHVDHFGGVRGVISEEDLKIDTQIVAPFGFVEHALSENLLAGTAMGRRAGYMYGSILKRGPKGQVDAGIGKNTSTGTVGLILPTRTIAKTGETVKIDGIEILFQLTSGAEAPADMNMYFPQLKALCLADNVLHSMHNLYTLRGAQVRDAKEWSEYLKATVEMFGDKAEIAFTQHTWPMLGKERIKEYIKKQAHAYKYIHDQTLRLANKGYTPIEIAEMIQLPDSLGKEWFNRDYYGTVNHNAKAVYQKYLGWFDGNPANLYPLPPEEAAKNYVKYMGGEAAAIKKAKASFEKGEYRWVAEVMKHVVFANPKGKAGKELLADTYEQLGYQSESGPWRNIYLAGAQELREGVNKAAPAAVSTDMLRALELTDLFDYLSINLDGPKAAGEKICINWKMEDTEEKFLVTIENGVLDYYKDGEIPNADISVSLDRKTILMLLAGKLTFQQIGASGKIKGNMEKLGKMMSLFDKPEPFFNIVTP